MKKKERIIVKLDPLEHKPQNTAVLALTQVKGGKHEKTNKAKRAKSKQALKRELRSVNVDRPSFNLSTKA